MIINLKKVAPLDVEAGSEISIHPITWDLLATIVTDDRNGMIFRQRVSVYSIPVAGSQKLVVSAELGKTHSEPEISRLIDQIVESVVQFHHVAPYSITLHSPFTLPQHPDGSLDLIRIRDEFEKGTLESLYCLSLPWRNLESSLPNAIAPGCVVGAAGMVCGSVISGTSLSYLSGRDLKTDRMIKDTLAGMMINNNFESLKRNLNFSAS